MWFRGVCLYIEYLKQKRKEKTVFILILSKTIMKRAFKSRLLSAMLAALMLFGVTLIFASCNSTDANAETTSATVNQESETPTTCDEVGHSWGYVVGNPYADSICTICGYCRHNSGVSSNVYKAIDAKYHAYGDMCYACFEFVDPIIEEHTFVDGYCDYCLQEAPDFLDSATDIACGEAGHTWGSIPGHPYAGSICVICEYCRHDSGISSDIYRIVDEKYHAHGDQCYACFKLIDAVIEEHTFVDGYCDYCMQEEP